jgi:hypothetical protein
MNGKMNPFIEEHEVSGVLDVLRPPAERDLPPDRLTERKQMLLAEITAPQSDTGARHPLRSRLRRLAGWFACLSGVVLVALGASRADLRPIDSDHVAQALAVASAGAVVAVHAGFARSEVLQLDRKRSSASPTPALIVS